jgi:hypothetical protein
MTVRNDQSWTAEEAQRTEAADVHAELGPDFDVAYQPLKGGP